MSSTSYCDKCGASGKRQMGRIAPEGWSYAEIKDDVNLDTFFVYACSEACKQLPWRPGPGTLNLEDREVVPSSDVPSLEGAEVNPCSGMVALLTDQRDIRLTLKEGDTLVIGDIRLKVGSQGDLLISAGNVVQKRIFPDVLSSTKTM